ncbi:MAG: hypothetical protein AAB947_00545, partial [Patescibacteria group bacterium]
IPSCSKSGLSIWLSKVADRFTLSHPCITVKQARGKMSISATPRDPAARVSRCGRDHCRFYGFANRALPAISQIAQAWSTQEIRMKRITITRIKRKCCLYVAHCAASRDTDRCGQRMNETLHGPDKEQAKIDKELWEKAYDRKSKIERIFRRLRGPDNWHSQRTIRGLEWTCDRIEREKELVVALIFLVPTGIILAFFGLVRLLVR